MKAMFSTRASFRCGDEPASAVWAILPANPMSSSMRAAAMSITPIATGARGCVSISLRAPTPNSRFLRRALCSGRSVLHAGNPAPRVDDVLLNYLPKNVAPEIDEIVVQPGYRYQAIPHVTGSDAPRKLRASRVSILHLPRCAIVTQSASAGRHMTITTISSCTRFTTAARANRVGCC